MSYFSSIVNDDRYAEAEAVKVAEELQARVPDILDPDHGFGPTGFAVVLHDGSRWQVKVTAAPREDGRTYHGRSD